MLKIAVYENSSNLAALFPENFHKDLKGLILQIIEARLPQWRDTASSDLTFFPKLQEFDWRVDVKRASDASDSISVPTVIVQLKVHNLVTLTLKVARAPHKIHRKTRTKHCQF